MAGKRRKCVCGCGAFFLDGEIVRRGLRPSCYEIARRRVAAGEVTWKQLEAEGVVAPSGRHAPRSALGKKIAALSSGG